MVVAVAVRCIPHALFFLLYFVWPFDSPFEREREREKENEIANRDLHSRIYHIHTRVYAYTLLRLELPF